MKRGTIVAVCQDGKWSRRVKGEVIATRQGHHIKVRFPHPDTNEPVEFWARKSRTVRYMRKRPGSVFTYRTRYRFFGGWAEIDTFCPWYSVVKWPKSE